MVTYILLIALVNLGLGFALAVYHGRQRPAMVPSAPWVPPQPRVEAPAAATGDLFPVVTEEEPVCTETEDASEESGTSCQPSDAAPDQEPSPTASAPDGTDEVLRREPSPGESSMLALQAGVRDYEETMLEVSDDLRSPDSSPTAEWLESRIKALDRVNEQYLEQRNTAYGCFRDLHRDVGEYSAISGDVQEAMDRQSRQIEESNDRLGRLDIRADLEESRRRATVEAERFVEANHQVRDVLDKAMVEIARHEQWLDAAGGATDTDATTGLPNRTGLEAELARWWSKDVHRVRQLGAAMLDIDHFSRLNERCGQRFGTEVLGAVAKLVSMETRGSSIVARYSGQQFVILFPDDDIREATSIVEKARQTIELTEFQTATQEAHVTLSCGVAEGNSQDTSESLFSRLEASVREAKRYGRNRTFVHDGKYPTPVVPPNLVLQPRTFTL